MRQSVLLLIALYSLSVAPVFAQIPEYSASPSASTPTNTPTPSSSRLTCDNLEVVSKVGGYTPATIQFKTNPSDTSLVREYRYDFGNGKTLNAQEQTISHRYKAAGTYLASVVLIDQQGKQVSSPDCQTEIEIKPVPLVAHHASCTLLEIISGSKSSPAPSNITFEISGSDNKGPIAAYRVEFGDGQELEQASDSAKLTHTYQEPGTYKAVGYIQDSQGIWKTSNPTCEQEISVTSTTIMEQQPETGPSPFVWYSLMLMVSSGLLIRQIAHSKTV